MNLIEAEEEVWECRNLKKYGPHEPGCDWTQWFTGEGGLDIDNVDVVPDPANPDSGEMVLRVFYAEGSYAGNPIDKGKTRVVDSQMWSPKYQEIKN